MFLRCLRSFGVDFGLCLSLVVGVPCRAREGSGDVFRAVTLTASVGAVPNETRAIDLNRVSCLNPMHPMKHHT